MNQPITLTIRDRQDLVDLVREARSTGRSLLPVGGRTRLGAARIGGTPVRWQGPADILDLAPDDLLVTVSSHMPLADLQAVLRTQGLMLPLEAPPGATVGGTVAHGTTGKRLHGWGLPRAWVVGVDLVLGTGDEARMGASVIKNVAGYDGVRLFCGSRGTLAFATAVTFRLVPLARGWSERVWSGSHDETLSRVLEDLRAEELSWLEVRSGGDPAGSGADGVATGNGRPAADGIAQTLRLDGSLPWTLCAGRDHALEALPPPCARGNETRMSGTHAAPFEEAPPWAEDPAEVWHVALRPSQVPTFLGEISRSAPRSGDSGRETTWAFRAAIGRGWVRLAFRDAGPDLGPWLERSILAREGYWRKVRPVPESCAPVPGTRARIERNLKQACDPDDIMARGLRPGTL